MADRHAQVLVLLATRFDGLPEPARRDHAPAGFVHATPAPAVCPTCEGVDDAGRCPTCRGSGTVEVLRRRDPYATDRVTPYGLEATAKLGHVAERDAELARLEAQTARPLASEADLVAEANAHPWPWERARAAMYARFDYRALDLALERLHADHPGIAAVSVSGLVLLDGWMPDPIRAPREVRAAVNAAARGRGSDPRARGQRDDLVRRLAGDGVPYGEIAASVGLSAAQLRRIVNGQAAA